MFVETKRFPFCRGFRREKNNGVTSSFALGVNFSSSSFVIHVNLLHPEPSLFRYGLLSSFWCFSILPNYYFYVHSYELYLRYQNIKEYSLTSEEENLDQLSPGQ